MRTGPMRTWAGVPAMLAWLCVLAAPAAATPPSVTGATYYVSASGSDSAAGTSVRAPWRTVGRVNRASLRPGDAVLFEGGRSFGDATLMPPRSGESGAPIVFGSYGAGEASIPRGVWFMDSFWLTFDELAIGGGGVRGSGGGRGTGNIVVRGCTIADTPGTAIIAPHPGDRDWSIVDNAIRRTGDSGVILLGSGHEVTGNAIEDTGLDATLGYGRHGVYLKASESRIAGNSIRGFASNGVSARFHGSVVEGNTIRDGPIGIAWFQNDPVGGSSVWHGNAIAGTTAAGIYISPADSAGATREEFTIEGNVLSRSAGKWIDAQNPPESNRRRANVFLGGPEDLVAGLGLGDFDPFAAARGRDSDEPEEEGEGAGDGGQGGGEENAGETEAGAGGAESGAGTGAGDVGGVGDASDEVGDADPTGDGGEEGVDVGDGSEGDPGGDVDEPELIDAPGDADIEYGDLDEPSAGDEASGDEGGDVSTGAPPSARLASIAVNRSTGAATLTVAVSEAGTVTAVAGARLAGRRSRRVRIGRARAAAAHAGRVLLTVRPSAAARAVLRRRHRLPVVVRVAYAPRNAASTAFSVPVVLRLR